MAQMEAGAPVRTISIYIFKLMGYIFINNTGNVITSSNAIINGKD